MRREKKRSLLFENAPGAEVSRAYLEDARAVLSYREGLQLGARFDIFFLSLFLFVVVVFYSRVVMGLLQDTGDYPGFFNAEILKGFEK